MEEQIVSFKVVCLARDLGYTQESTLLSQPYYNHKGVLNGDVIDYIWKYLKFKDGTIPQEEINKVQPIRAMTQSQLQKWIREKHDLHIQITVEAFKNGYNWGVQIMDLKFDNSETENWKEFGDRTTGLYGDNHEYETYEDALEFGLELALNKIEL